jgi:hypothetical protein
MREYGARKAFRAGLILAVVLGLIIPALGRTGGQETSTFASALMTFLPKPGEWQPAEPPEQYLPENLFEYIDGAAEAFLSYNFQELLVAQYKNKSFPTGSLTVEVYDMGTGLQAFGMYGAERTPDSAFIPIGVQGYYEEGSLNFLAGRYYIKLMCYDCGPAAENTLKSLAADIAGRVPDKTDLPVLLAAFPRAGLAANSEKYILRNFQGLSFLQNGFQADYKLDGREFQCFIVETADEAKAEALAGRYLDNYKRSGSDIKSLEAGTAFKDKYLLNIFAARVGRFLCGVTRIPDGQEETGRAYLALLVKSLKTASRL